MDLCFYITAASLAFMVVTIALGCIFAKSEKSLENTAGLASFALFLIVFCAMAELLTTYLHSDYRTNYYCNTNQCPAKITFQERRLYMNDKLKDYTVMPGSSVLVRNSIIRNEIKLDIEGL